MADVWASGTAYEPYVGRWSRLVAREFLSWLAVPPGRRWLDVGCGTGALGGVVVAMASPTHVDAVDRSEGYVAYARAQVGDPRVRFEVADAQALPSPDASYDAVVSGLVLNFVPEPARAVAEMRRVARPGGIAAAYVWDYAEKMELMRHFWDAAVALDPGARDLERGTAVLALPAGAARSPLHGGRAREGGRATVRRVHGLPRLRRLLVAVPRRPGTRAGLRHVAFLEIAAPRCVTGSAPAFPPRPTGRSVSRFTRSRNRAP